MSLLESRYRRLLRLLPPAYREVREDEMVDTFLLTMQQDDPEDDEIVQRTGHPAWSERLSVAGLALHLWWGGRHAPARYRALGGAVQWCVAAILLIHAVSALPDLLARLWLAGALPVAPPAASSGMFLVASNWSWATVIAGALWIPAFVALALDRPRTAQLCAGLATASALVAMVARSVVVLFLGSPERGWSLVWGWSGVVIDAAVVLGLCAFHREAPGLQPRPWLMAGAVALAALAASALMPGVARWVWVDSASWWCLGSVAGGVAVAAVARRWPAAARVQAMVGLSLLCGAAFLVRAGIVVDLAMGGGWGVLPQFVETVVVVQLLLVGVIGAGAGILGVRELRRLPNVTYAPGDNVAT